MSETAPYRRTRAGVTRAVSAQANGPNNFRALAGCPGLILTRGPARSGWDERARRANRRHRTSPPPGGQKLHRRGYDPVAMEVLFSFVPSAATSLDSLPAVTAAQLDRLRTEVAKAKMADPPFISRAGAAASLVRGGQKLYWGFATVWDTLACVRYAADPRCPLDGTSVDVVRLDAEPLVADPRFVRPGGGSLLTEVPHRAPIQQQRWLEHALYKNVQFIFRLATTPEPSTPMRMPADLLLQRALTAALRRANTPKERQRIQLLPRESASWNPSALAGWGDCGEPDIAASDLFTPSRRRRARTRLGHRGH